jgi:hypothetical protein
VLRHNGCVYHGRHGLSAAEFCCKTVRCTIGTVQ